MRLLSLLLLLGSVHSAQADDYVPAPEKTGHWAWQAPARPRLPTPDAKAWVRNPVDAFILAKLEAAGLKPTRPASREQLIRRVTLDLVGLPPTPAEIDAFVNDSAPNPWEKVLDRLLASPHYGERWGRHWLDLVRFAESNGYEHDEIRPDAWRYRDYVIQSLNSDKPYDRFLQEQLAGDELFPDDIEARIATGFNVLGPDMTDSANPVQRRQNTLDDITDTTSLVFVGLTVGCARCHDHKFEPIPQTDFYRWQAFFAPANFRKDIPVAQAEDLKKHAGAEEEYQKLVAPITEAVAKIEEPYRRKLYEMRLKKLADAAQEAHRTDPDKRTTSQQALVEQTNRLLTVSAKEVTDTLAKPDQVKVQALQKELKKFASQKPRPLPVAMGIQDGAKSVKTVVLVRGELNHPGEEVQPGFPIILSPDFASMPAKVTPPSTKTTGRRAALARWLTSKDNPLTARVMVNRLWQHHFGRGIVATPNDFGVRGEKPTHPNLLDWLAREFSDNGWSIKHMHRLMLASATYQQSTFASRETLAADPGNSLFSRMNRLRLEGEIVRDSLLAVSGRLNSKRGGPSVLPPLPSEVVVQEWKVTPDPSEHGRRSVYIFARRNVRFPFLETFDLPDSNQSCPKRERSTTAPQALALLNDRDMSAAAKALAERLQRETSSKEEQIKLAFRLTLGRGPSPAEMNFAQDFLTLSPLTEFCRTMFNINEFVYLD
ncbi:MAG TPA: DUF1549 and DUF1553 domain-containing protein [Gemmataceae bacterium]|nr:DUF1549 and DUF1553 domain-containing protein [Gemmataceae bacterium]